MFQIRPIALKAANQFVTKLHRHHQKVQGHKFSIGIYTNDKLVGVAICGRPVARHLDTGYILEVTRLCTDVTKNACSKLYSACAKIAQAMGYEKIITYILESETGTSLKAAGWQCEAEGVGAKSWVDGGRQRTDRIVNLFGEFKKYPNELKKRWAKKLN